MDTRCIQNGLKNSAVEKVLFDQDLITTHIFPNLLSYTSANHFSYKDLFMLRQVCHRLNDLFKVTDEAQKIKCLQNTIAEKIPLYLELYDEYPQAAGIIAGGITVGVGVGPTGLIAGISPSFHYAMVMPAIYVTITAFTFLNLYQNRNESNVVWNKSVLQIKAASTLTFASLCALCFSAFCFYEAKARSQKDPFAGLDVGAAVAVLVIGIMFAITSLVTANDIKNEVQAHSLFSKSNHERERKNMIRDFFNPKLIEEENSLRINM